MGMEESTSFGMKNGLLLPSLANKSTSRAEKDEPIHTYTDRLMRNFVRNSIKGGRCNALNQRYKTEISDNVFKIISKKLDVNGNICEILDRFFEFLKKFEELYAEEVDSKNDDYRDINQKEKLIVITQNLTCYQVMNSSQK